MSSTPLGKRAVVRTALFAFALACGAFACAQLVGIESIDFAPPTEAGVPDQSAVDAPRCSPDLKTDPLNCGRCGHPCTFGACVDGVCDFAAVVTSDAAIVGVTVQGNGLYFSDELGRISRAELDGGASTELARIDAATELNSFADGVIFGGMGPKGNPLAYTMPLDGGAPVKLFDATGSVQSIGLLASGVIYYLIDDGSYWWSVLEPDGGASAGIGMSGEAGLSLEAIPGANPITVAVDDSALEKLYFATSPYSAPTVQHGRGISGDEQYFYWSEDSPDGGRVLRSNRRAPELVDVLARTPGPMRDIAAGPGGTVYAITGNRIVRIEPP